MAARRLLIVMLVLLGLSTLAAALVPTRSLNDAGTGSTIAGETQTEATVPTDTVPRGKPLELKIRVGGDQIPIVPIEVGDQLALTVVSRNSDQLEIPALGLIETVGPNLPATFDVLAEQRGDIGIRAVSADRVVAKIRVERRSKKAGKREVQPSVDPGV
jgi:hypothetical protein